MHNRTSHNTQKRITLFYMHGIVSADIRVLSEAVELPPLYTIPTLQVWFFFLSAKNTDITFFYTEMFILHRCIEKKLHSKDAYHFLYNIPHPTFFPVTCLGRGKGSHLTTLKFVMTPISRGIMVK